MKQESYHCIYFFIIIFYLIFLPGCGDDEIKLNLTIDGKGIILLNDIKYENSATIIYEETEVLKVVYDDTTYDDWEFVSFSGALTGTSNSQTLTMNENKILTATFQLENSVIIDGYVKDIDKNSIENVIVSTGISNIDEVTATTSSKGYYQLKNVPVPSDKRVYLTYQKENYENKTIYVYKEKAEMTVEDIELLREYQLTFQNSFYSIGSTSPEPKTYTYTENEVKTITAVCSDILQFSKWSGDVPSSEDATSVGISITMDQNRTIVAEFIALTTYTLQVSYNEQHGSVSQTPDGNNHVSGKSIILNSTPETGYEFEHWINKTGEIITNNPLNITLDSDLSYTCVFSEKKYVLASTKSGEGIVKLTPESENNAYLLDTLVKIIAIPAQGWKFRNWEGASESSVQQISVIMDSDKAIKAIFEKPYASLSGQITDENGTGLSGVQVMASSELTTSDNNGYYLLDNAELSQELDNITVLFKKQGYCLYSQVISAEDQQMLNLSPQLSQDCQAGKIDLLTLIKTLSILTQKKEDVFSVDIDNNGHVDLVEVLLLMRDLSE